MIEKFIPGREIQVAILDRKKLGAIELKPKRKFYDYEAKYNPNSKTGHIIPVKISKKQYNQIKNRKNLSDDCLNALWNSTGCDGSYIDSSSSNDFLWNFSFDIYEIPKKMD